MKVRITVPVLTLRNSRGRIDKAANADYASRAAETWLDHFMVNGTIGGGETSTPAERRTLLEIWAKHLPAERLLACTWNPDDLGHAADVGIRPITVLQQLSSHAKLTEYLGTLPDGAWIYSHPKYSSATFSPLVAEEACRGGFLPDGGKICKIDLDTISQLRAATRSEFQLYDGRCRHLTRSIEAGATGVIAVPLAPLPPNLPERNDVNGVQEVIDRTQARLDSLPNLSDRIAMLTAQLHQKECERTATAGTRTEGNHKP
jgi:hypothetical protein